MSFFLTVHLRVCVTLSHLVHLCGSGGLPGSEHVLAHEAERLAVHGEPLGGRAAPLRPAGHVAARPAAGICKRAVDLYLFVEVFPTNYNIINGKVCK